MNPRDFSTRALCSYLRNRLGSRVTSGRVGKLVGSEARGVVVLEKLVAARLARRHGAVFVLSDVVKVPRTAKRRYRYPVAVAYVMGQPVKAGLSEKVPDSGKRSWVKVGVREEEIVYRGKVDGGWLVQPI